MDSSISFDKDLGYWLPYIDYVLVPTSEGGLSNDNQYSKQKRVYYIPDIIYDKFKKDIEYLNDFFNKKGICNEMKNYFIIVKKSTFPVSNYQSFRAGKSIDILNYNNVITKRSNIYNPNRVFNSINPVHDSITFVKNVSNIYLDFLSGNTDLRESVFVIRLINQQTNFYSHASLSDTQRLTFKKLLFTSFYFSTNNSEYPIRDNLIEYVYKEKDRETIVDHAESIRVLLPQDIFSLMRAYINLGYSKKYYMDVNSMIVRLLTRRFLYWYTSKHIGLRTFEERKNLKLSGDAKTYVLDGESPFYYIKKDLLDDYLSYRESYIASFLGTSSFTFIINNGSIHNSGIYSGDHVKEIVYVGICGPIFNEPLKYDHETLLVTEMYHTKTIKDDKYMELWIKYFGENKSSIVKGKFSKNVEIPSYKFIKDNEEEYKYKYIHLVTDDHAKLYFDVHGFMKRITTSYELYLYDVVERIKDNSFKKVWIIFTNIVNESFINVALQTRLILITILGLIEKFKKEENIEYIFEINNFELTDVKLEEFINNKNIILGDGLKFLTSLDLKNVREHIPNIIFTDNPPFSGIITKGGTAYNKNEYKVFCNYSSNVKSLPGNEYWDGNLKTVSSSAACCSTISQLHNPYVNYKILDYRNFRVVDG